MKRNNIHLIRAFLLLIFLAGISTGYSAATYSNPIISEIGPADPTILYHDGIYYMYPTGDNVSYHVYTSTDLVHWQKGAKVFEPGGINVWAPDVFYHSFDDKFYMYYTQDSKIGVAVADQPTGPFVDQGILLNGFIDGHLFQNDDGKYYLYFTDIGHIYVQQMSTPLTLTGSRQVILQPSQSWEMQWGSVNEGPWMIKHDGLYYLLYSGSGADSQYYAVGYATATDPMGPFTKYSGNPIVHSGGGVYGPGHGAVTTDAAGNLWHIYHQKVDTAVDWNRFIAIDPMWFDESGVLCGQATRGIERPAPIAAENAGTVAWWRFEAGPVNTQVQSAANGPAWSADIPDSSGNGNELSVWDSGQFMYRDGVPYTTIPLTGETNHFSVKNTTGGPAMWTSPDDPINSITPARWTVEVTFKLENGEHRTIVGRDSYGTATQGNVTNAALSAFYLQATPENAVAVKFCDVDGYWHDAISEAGAIVTFDYGSDNDGLTAPSYSMAAVSDGTLLSLYLLNHDTPELGYQLVAQTDMTVTNPGSTNTAMTAGADHPDGRDDWEPGNWSVARGLFNAGHGDRAWGYIDEVRISEVALKPSEFLCSQRDVNTVAYWRFEEGPANAYVSHGGLSDGEFYPGTLDQSGNGNDLSVWSDSNDGRHIYRENIPAAIVPQTSEDNNFSLENNDDYPGLFTSSDSLNVIGTDLETWSPSAFTIEASFKPLSGGYRTIIGRDGQNVATDNDKLAALYFQLLPDDSVAIKFADVEGYWHQAVSATGLIQYDGDGHWYNMAAVSDGSTLSLYLDDVDRGIGYQLVAQTDLTASGSGDTRLVADTGNGSGWHSGGWSVGRGLYEGDHVDRMLGHIDEVRISKVALDPSEFLFHTERYADVIVSPEDLAVREEGPTSDDLFFSLKNPPVDDVVLTIQEQNQRGQVLLAPTTLTFTNSNWNDLQAINVTAVDDSDLENTEHQVPLSITVYSALDQEYNVLEVAPVIVKVADNECGAWSYAVGDYVMDCVVNLNDLARFAEGWLECSDPDLAECTDFSAN